MHNGVEKSRSLRGKFNCNPSMLLVTVFYTAPLSNRIWLVQLGVALFVNYIRRCVWYNLFASKMPSRIGLIFHEIKTTGPKTGCTVSKMFSSCCCHTVNQRRRRRLKNEVREKEEAKKKVNKESCRKRRSRKRSKRGRTKRRMRWRKERGSWTSSFYSSFSFSSSFSVATISTLSSLPSPLPLRPLLHLISKINFFFIP